MGAGLRPGVQVGAETFLHVADLRSDVTRMMGRNGIEFYSLRTELGATFDIWW